ILTPTAAAILAERAAFSFPAMTIRRVGYGIGARELPWANVVRAWIVEAGSTAAVDAPEAVVEISTNIDDSDGQELGYAMERLLEAGALDVWFTPIQMKKGRPGVLLSVLCPVEVEDAIVSLLLRETSTLGVRLREVRRREAGREVLAFESSLGPAVVKVKRLPGEPPQAAPEYEVCRRLAEASSLPLVEVYRIVQAEAQALLGQGAGSGEP
ncbi:MAG: nickel insertion protein, partial [Dehalococcoidia bacterium]